jgi:hypothetical protein
MYKSPITIIDSFTESIIKQKDDAIFAEIQHSFGADVDKEELIRALQYDRNQYEKGYADGKADAMPKWIPVTERLPEEDGKYLVLEQSGGRTVTSVLRFAKDARKVDRYDFKGRWKNAWYEYDSEWGHYTVDSVTHWMPLPEPSKGE